MIWSVYRCRDEGRYSSRGVIISVSRKVAGASTVAVEDFNAHSWTQDLSAHSCHPHPITRTASCPHNAMRRKGCRSRLSNTLQLLLLPLLMLCCHALCVFPGGSAVQGRHRQDVRSKSGAALPLPVPGRGCSGCLNPCHKGRVEEGGGENDGTSVRCCPSTAFPKQGLFRFCKVHEPLPQWQAEGRRESMRRQQVEAAWCTLRGDVVLLSPSNKKPGEESLEALVLDFLPLAETGSFLELPSSRFPPFASFD